MIRRYERKLRTSGLQDFRTQDSGLKTACSGQVLVEFAIALPLLLFVTMAVMQFALVATAKLVVNHAAFVAARAALVGEDPEEAAEIACAPISGIRADAAGDPYAIPGRGDLARSGLSREKTSVEASVGAGRVRVDVTHDYELIFPVVSELFRTEGAEHGNWPHRRMTETCTLAKRWE